MRRADALLIALISAIFPLLLWLWRQSLDISFFAISGDDFHRTLYAWEVTQGNLLPSHLWPPLHFWAEALVLHIYPRLLAAPMLLNLTASTATLVCLLLFGHRLGLSGISLLLLALLGASSPWYIWLSLSGLAEPLFFFCIMLAYLSIAHWRMQQREWGLWVAAIGLLGAGMVRFDAWGHSVVFSLAVVWFWWRSSPPRPHRWWLAAAIPWPFPLFWLGYQYAVFDHPFYFSHVTRDYYLSTHSHNLPSVIDRLLWQPHTLWQLSTITILLGLAGLWLLRRRPGVGMLTLMWLGSFALLMYSTLNFTITQNHPIRLVVIHSLLLTPGATLVLQYFMKHYRGALVATALVAVLVIERIAAVPAYPNYLQPDTAAVGNYIATLRATGALQQGEGILIEVIFWDYLLLHVLSNDPAAVRYDREPLLRVAEDGSRVVIEENNPSLLALPPEELQDALQRHDVRLVVAHSPKAVENLRAIATETRQSGRFTVFLLPEETTP